VDAGSGGKERGSAAVATFSAKARSGMDAQKAAPSIDRLRTNDLVQSAPRGDCVPAGFGACSLQSRNRPTQAAPAAAGGDQVGRC